MSPAPFSFVPPAQAKRPYTISEINEGVCSIIESGNTLVWVEGEVSNYKRASSGHCYLKLKDAQSQIPAVVWKNTATQLGFVPEDGMQIVAIASLRVYTRGGYYQLDLHKLQPSGRGALYLAFEKLKKKLEAEGLFDPARKKPLPARVARLGVITSKNGAAVRDIIKVTRSRSPGTDIILIDVPVQGDKAAPAIAAAIRDMNKYGNVDCIIVGRGGGSIEDLWAFNEEIVARAIFESKLPIISAVGHEIDFTIADFVADVRAPTPSAAAEVAVADDEQNRKYFISMSRRLLRSFQTYFSGVRGAYRNLAQRPAFVRVHRTIREARQTLDDFEHLLQRCLTHAFRRFKDRHAKASAQLYALSPFGVMARGYSVVSRADGAVVKNVSQIVVGERVNIRFFKGSVKADIVDGTDL